MMQPDRDDDLELLDRWRRGDLSAGNTLVKRHYPAVYRLVRRRISDRGRVADVVQDIFATIVRTQEVIEYDVRRYVFWVAGLKILDHRRGRTRNPTVAPLPGSSMLAGQQRAMSSMVRESEGLQQVIAAYYRLPAEDQCLLAWKHFDARTQRELAALQGVNEAQMAGSLKRARDRWRAELRRSDEPVPATPDRTLASWLESMYSKTPPEGS